MSENTRNQAAHNNNSLSRFFSSQEASSPAAACKTAQSDQPATATNNEDDGSVVVIDNIETDVNRSSNPQPAKKKKVLKITIDVDLTDVDNDSVRVESSAASQKQKNQPPSHDTNPFAKFAAAARGPPAAQVRRSWTVFQPSSQSRTNHKRDMATQTVVTKNHTRKKSKKKSEWIKMADLPTIEQERVVQKWHSLTFSQHTSPPHHQDNNESAVQTYSMEDRRFQVLVAARLHAQCQEPAVRKAMETLNQYMPITVQAMAVKDPDEWKTAVQNLQYYSTKAKQLQQAAQQVQTMFDSKVPQHEHELKQLMGVGPMIADLLAFVNTRERHAAATTTEE